MIADSQNSALSKVLVTFHGSVPATCERPVHHKLRSQSFTLAERHTHVTGIKNARYRSNSSESSEMKPKVRGRRQSKKIRLFEPIASKLSARLRKSQFKAFNRIKHNGLRWGGLKRNDDFKPETPKLSAHPRKSHFKAFKTVKRHVSHARGRTTKHLTKRLSRQCLFY